MMTEPPDDDSKRASVHDERASVEGQAPSLPELSPEDEARLEAKNGLRQVSAMVEAIESSLKTGKFRLRPSAIMELQRYAVEGIKPDAGAYRRVPISITNSKHDPPHSREVSAHADDMCDYVNDHWNSATPIHLASYVMWRLNWIHPFSDGNGRTSRVVSYLVLCAKLGFLLPGQETIPERIASSKFNYYDALDDADAHWAEDRLDVSQMEALLEGHLAQQLVSVQELASGKPIM